MYFKISSNFINLGTHRFITVHNFAHFILLDELTILPEINKDKNKLLYDGIHMINRNNYLHYYLIIKIIYCTQVIMSNNII